MRDDPHFRQVERSEEALKPEGLSLGSTLRLRKRRAQSIARAVGRNDPEVAVVEGKENFLRKAAAAMQEEDWKAMWVATVKDVNILIFNMKCYSEPRLD